MELLTPGNLSRYFEYYPVARVYHQFEALTQKQGSTQEERQRQQQQATQQGQLEGGEQQGGAYGTLAGKPSSDHSKAADAQAGAGAGATADAGAGEEEVMPSMAEALWCVIICFLR